MRFIRFNVAVNHGSTFELNTTLTDEALGAKAAADAGSNWGGIEEIYGSYRWRVLRGYAAGDRRARADKKGANKEKVEKEQ